MTSQLPGIKHPSRLRQEKTEAASGNTRSLTMNILKRRFTKIILRTTSLVLQRHSLRSSSSSGILRKTNPLSWENLVKDCRNTL